jgi:hypothetical protein
MCPCVATGFDLYLLFLVYERIPLLHFFYSLEKKIFDIDTSTYQLVLQKSIYTNWCITFFLVKIISGRQYLYCFEPIKKQCVSFSILILLSLSHYPYHSF